MTEHRLAAIPDPSVLRRLHPAVRKVWLLSTTVGVLVLLAILVPLSVFLAPKMNIGTGTAAAAAVLLALLPMIRALIVVDHQYRAWGYVLTDHELVARWGVWWQAARYVPRDSIQHVDVNQGPVDQRNGIAQVLVYTAASPVAVVTIPGLGLAEAEELRDRLLAVPEPSS